MSPVSERKKVLITVKTYPTLSKKYDELVCTAGIRAKQRTTHAVILDGLGVATGNALQPRQNFTGSSATVMSAEHITF